MKNCFPFKCDTVVVTLLCERKWCPRQVRRHTTHTHFTMVLARISPSDHTKCDTIFSDKCVSTASLFFIHFHHDMYATMTMRWMWCVFVSHCHTDYMDIKWINMKSSKNVTIFMLFCLFHRTSVSATSRLASHRCPHTYGNNKWSMAKEENVVRTMLSFLDGGKWHHTHTQRQRTQEQGHFNVFLILCRFQHLLLIRPFLAVFFSSLIFGITLNMRTLLDCLAYTRSHWLFLRWCAMAVERRIWWCRRFPIKYLIFSMVFMWRMHACTTRKVNIKFQHISLLVFSALFMQKMQSKEKTRKFSCENEKMIWNLGRIQRRVPILIN